MRRAVPVVAATAGGLALLANFHTTPSTSGVAAGPASSSTSSAPASTEPPGSSTPGSTPSSAAASNAPPGWYHSLDGPVIDTRWGPVQVRVDLAGRKITDVHALQLPFEKARSKEISDAVEPLLHDEVLRAQSARIDVVSGATYTSEGYITSLQNALG